MDKERAASADVLEYRVARMYDNEECYPQDIVSLVLEYQGSPAVNVTTRGGSTMSWSSSSYHSPQYVWPGDRASGADRQGCAYVAGGE